LAALGHFLREQRYAFTAVTPATHAQVWHRAPFARSLRDVFGWNVPFAPADFPVSEYLRAAGALEPAARGLVRSAVRYATAGDQLFVHSAYPTLGDDSVFFGPDTYRFLRVIRAFVATRDPGRVVDVGAGSGAGGLCTRAQDLVLADINPSALAAARTNLAINGARATAVHSDILANVDGPIDTVIANPPFMADARGRAYRDGGGRIGTGVACRIVAQALTRLSAGGALLLYTGAPIAAGRDLLAEALGEFHHARVASWSYEEIDPDIFGDELSEPAYDDIERIAAVQLTVTMK
jgi:hypothetical protein